MNVATRLDAPDRFDDLISDMVKDYFPELLKDLTEFGWYWGQGSGLAREPL